MKLSKKQLISLSIILLLTISCKKPTQQKVIQSESFAEKISDTLPSIKQNQKITEFKAFVKQLDNKDISSVSKGIDKFRIEFQNQNKTLCDTAFVVYQQLIDSLELNLNLNLQNDTTDYSSLYDGETVSQNIKDIQVNLNQNGYKLSSAEGMVYVEQDRKFFIPLFEAFITDAMRNYLKQIAIENEEGFASDAAITITPKQHVDRIIWYEVFISNNPEFVLLNNCKDYKKAYLSYLLSGFDNTPLFKDQSNAVLSDYYIKGYNYLLKKYPESESAKLVKPYFDALKKNQMNSANELYKNYVIKGLIYNMK